MLDLSKIDVKDEPFITQIIEGLGDASSLKLMLSIRVMYWNCQQRSLKFRFSGCAHANTVIIKLEPDNAEFCEVGFWKCRPTLEELEAEAELLESDVDYSRILEEDQAGRNYFSAEVCHLKQLFEYETGLVLDVPVIVSVNRQEVIDLSQKGRVLAVLPVPPVPSAA